MINRLLGIGRISPAIMGLRARTESGPGPGGGRGPRTVPPAAAPACGCPARAAPSARAGIGSSQQLGEHLRRPSAQRQDGDVRRIQPRQVGAPGISNYGQTGGAACFTSTSRHLPHLYLSTIRSHPTRAGKTTLLQALMRLPPSKEPVLVLDDCEELDLDGPLREFVPLRRGDSAELPREAVARALRDSPRRLVFRQRVPSRGRTGSAGTRRRPPSR